MTQKEPINSAVATTAGEQKRFLAFSLGTEEYAVPLLSVREVIALPEFTPIPYTPPHFLGIMNLRGQVISVIDLRLKLGLKAPQSSETAVIICDLNSVCLGIVVNSVDFVMTLSEGEIQPPPEVQSSNRTDYITGVTKREQSLVVLLDIARCLGVSEKQILQQMASKKSA